MNTNIFQKAFPQIEKPKHKLLFSFFVSVFVYFFLLVFRPFNLGLTDLFLPVFILGYAAITFAVMSSTYFVLFPNFSFFDAGKWTVGKIIIMIGFQLFFIAAFNWAYTNLFAEHFQQDVSFVSFIFYTFSVGFIILIFIVLLTENYLNKTHSHRAKTMADNIKSNQIDTNRQLSFISDNLKDNFSILENQLYCIRSEKNYLDIYYSENAKLEKRTIRTSLLKLEKQFENNPNIKRCHKSYMVNMSQISKVTGNARNYNFYIEGIDFPILVSRNFPKHLIKKIENL